MTEEDTFNKYEEHIDSIINKHKLGISLLK